MRTKKRLISGLIAAALCFSLIGIAVAESLTYTGDALVAINTDYSTETPTYATIGSEASIMAATEQTDDGVAEEISDIYIDPDTGETIIVTSPVFDEPEPVPVSPQDAPMGNVTAVPMSYKVGDLDTLTDYYGSTHTIKCLYVGTYCTVWGSTTDTSAIQITAAHAKQIADEFDSKCQNMVNSIGNWYDADGDGKLAILCYDIESNYGETFWSYTAGYFYNVNLADSNGIVNNIVRFTNAEAKDCRSQDCIHIDTYPGMGSSGNEMNDIPRCYSTLFHEMQHLINFSYQVTGSSYLSSMETYINEAFSMGTEQMLYGPSATASRVTYFNDPYSYQAGWPLTYWASDLSNYSNSYLFGQYIRTRYSQLPGKGDGSTIFREVLESRTDENEEDTLSIICNLLNTDKDTLIADFWSAVYCKQASGPHGFNGEAWANSIQPYLYSLNISGNIYNGGAVFLNLSSGSYTPTSTTGLKYIAFKDGAVVGSVPDTASVGVAVSDGTANITVNSTKNGTAVAAIFDGLKMVHCETLTVTPGSRNWPIDVSDYPGCTIRVFLVDNLWLPQCGADKATIS